LQVAKINKFTQGQTRSLEARLNKLQEQAAVATTRTEKQELLAVRLCCTASPQAGCWT
jgi:hypothetical protein